LSSDERKTDGDGEAEPAAPAAGEPDTTTAAPDTTMAVSAPGERMDLPKWNRARVKRAPTKAEGAAETDAFQQGVRDAGKAAARRMPLVLLGFVGVAVLVGGAIWLSRKGDETVATATRPLAEAAAWRYRGQLVDIPAKRVPPPPAAEIDANVERKLSEVTAAGEDKVQRYALLVRAGKQVETADFAGAETTYREFLTRAGTSHDLAFLAREGVAIALEGQGDLEGALAAFEEMLGNPGDFYRDQALWHKARLLERLERKDDALAAYQQYATEYPLTEPSLAKAAVRARLAELDPSMVLPAEPLPGGLEELLVP
jgi:tetratricopeptide (TPR) repeat protein